MVSATSNAYEVLAIRYASRQAVKSEVYLNFHLGTDIVAGHDPVVFSRFPGRGAGSVYARHVIRIAALDTHTGR